MEIEISNLLLHNITYVLFIEQESNIDEPSQQIFKFPKLSSYPKESQKKKRLIDLKITGINVLDFNIHERVEMSCTPDVVKKKQQILK